MHREPRFMVSARLGRFSVLPLLVILVGCTATARFDLSNHRPEGQQGSHHGTAETGGETARRASLGWTARRKTMDTSFDHEVIVVREGETLHAIARRYDLPVWMLERANGLASDHIVPGQQIVVPLRRPVP